jgi:hypothetical protein
MLENEWFIRAATVALFFVGLVLPWWPLAVCGVILSAAFGRWILALLLAFVLDSVFGAPTGFLHALAFPITFLTLLIVIVRAFSIRHLR